MADERSALEALRAESAALVSAKETAAASAEAAAAAKAAEEKERRAAATGNALKAVLETVGKVSALETEAARKQELWKIEMAKVQNY